MVVFDTGVLHKSNQFVCLHEDRVILCQSSVFYFPHETCIKAEIQIKKEKEKNADTQSITYIRHNIPQPST